MKLAQDNQEPNGLSCQECGKDLVGQRRKYCSQECINASTKKAHDKASVIKVYECEVCYKEFTKESKTYASSTKYCSEECKSQEYINIGSTYGTGILSLDYDPNGIFAGSYDEYPIDPEILARAEAKEEKYIHDHGVRSLISKMAKNRKGAFKKPRKNTLNSFN